MKAAIIDLETTGLLKHPQAKAETQPRCIEFGAVVINAAGQELETMSQLINPKQKIESVITKITGLTNEDLAGQPMFEEVVDDIMSLLNKCDAVIAHNLPFDKGVLSWEFGLLGLDFEWPAIEYCTVQEDMCVYGYRIKLQNLFKDTTDRAWKQKHRALDDCIALAETVVSGPHLDAIKWAFAHTQGAMS